MAMSRVPFWGASQLSVVGPVGRGEAGSGDGKGLKVRFVWCISIGWNGVRIRECVEEIHMFGSAKELC